MRKEKKPIEHWMLINTGLVVFDFIATYVSYYLALLLRFDMKFPNVQEKFMMGAQDSILYVAIFVVLCTWLFKLYNSIWRYAGVAEIVRGFACVLVVTIFNVIITSQFFTRMPISYYFIGGLVLYALCLSARFSYRFFLLIRKQILFNADTIRILVIGAGEAGTLIIRDINDNSRINEKVVCIIDDNPNKRGRYIGRVPIVGGIDTINENIRKYRIDRILVAIPSASKSELKTILRKAKETNKDVKMVPSLYSLTNEPIKLTNIKDVEITDLLGRDEVKTDLKEVFKFIRNKVVLVTGAGGSIGSELSRQIAANNPKQLILFDIYENSVYEIELELKKKYPGLSLVTLIGSVRDYKKVNELFDKYNPEIVYHAAAHKHVPLMEDSPNEAIKNNCFGTFNLAMAAILHNTKRFLLISSDKAVNPTNIMGASKRICEMIIQDFDKCINKGTVIKLVNLYNELYSEKIKVPKKIETVFSAVRFGNVLGSNGSVVPLFKKQIEHGGPVTVTHPDIVRYFMTIPEAVSLVLQSSVYSNGGEIFVLDMGEPVNITDLAKNMIVLSGKSLDDIPIVYTGLRPGEKLYEERLMDEEGLRETPNSMISIGKPLTIHSNQFISSLKKIYKKAMNNDEDMKYEVAKLVNTYTIDE